MSRLARIFFAKLAHFFRKYFGALRRNLNSDSNTDVPSMSLGVIQSPSPSQAQAPTPLASHVTTLPPTSSSSQPIPPFVQHGTPSLDPAASSPGCNALQSPQSLPCPLPLPPPQPHASRAPMPQLCHQTMFSGAHGFVLNHVQFSQGSGTKDLPGINQLLKNSMPDAFHNSAARDPPPKCHLGTRKEYIATITDWALGDSDYDEPILWIYGPFGIGKSAVAQSCAEVLQLHNKLAATLFFSRSNADRDDPRRVFTSIAYKIATICPTFANIVDARIRSDPALPKSPEIPFSRPCTKKNIWVSPKNIPILESSASYANLG